jgi:heme/copper-type cytochrome/quinol oxidase subunit 3
MTFALLTSSLTMVMAVHSMNRGNRAETAVCRTMGMKPW